MKRTARKTGKSVWVARTFRKCQACGQVFTTQVGRFENHTFEQMIAMTFDGEGRHDRGKFCTAHKGKT